MSLRELAGEIKCFYYELMSVEDNGFRVMQCFTVQQHLPQCVLQQSSQKEAAGNWNISAKHSHGCIWLHRRMSGLSERVSSNCM